MDEQDTVPVSVESVEVQSDTEENILAAELPVDPVTEYMEESEGVSITVPADDVENVVGDNVTSAATSDTLDSDRVEEIVEALLQSDRVNQLLDSVEYTLQIVSEAGERRPEETEAPVEVVSVEDVLDRMAVRASSDITEAAASPVPEPTAQLMEAGGEILVPGAGELTVIEIVQSILEYFQEDDNGLLTDIKEQVTEIKANTEIHPFLETPFEDYTILEGLLLILVLWLVVLKPCVSMIKGGFSWLMW